MQTRRCCGQHPSVFRFASLVFAFYFTLLSLPQTTWASELDEFQAARQAYEEQNFELAKERFERLVGTDMSPLRSRALMLESRKFLAATYIFIGENDAAEAQFRLLLKEDPSYSLLAAEFPAQILDVFSSVKADISSNEEPPEAVLEAKTEPRPTSQTIRRNSRWIAALPFGVGQFQNGDEALGWTLLIGEVVLGVASIALFFAHQAHIDAERGFAIGSPPGGGNADPGLTDDQKEYLKIEEQLRIANWAVLGAMAAVALIGITEAQITFVPEVVISGGDTRAGLGMLLRF